jgi:hypothetical protein
VKQGLYPELIAARLQKINPHIRVVNLAVNGGSQSDAIAYLNYLRDFRCTKPRLVVFDFEVSLTGMRTPPNAATLSSSASYLFDRKMHAHSGLWQEIAFLPSDLSLFVRHRGAIKHFLMDFLSLLPNAPVFEERSTIELCNANDAGTTYCGTSPDHNLTLDKELARRDSIIRKEWSGSPKSQDFKFNPEVYAPIIEYCQKNQIPLMLTWLPHEAYMYNERWYKEPYTKEWFKQQFQNYAKQFFVFPVYLNELAQNHAYFSDYRHLSTYGCVFASERLADTIAEPKYRSLIEHHENAIFEKMEHHQ